MEAKEDFYQELDKKGKRSACSCQVLALLMILVTALLSAGGIFLSQRITKLLPQPKPSLNLANHNLPQQLTDLQKTTGASTTLSITETQLTDIIEQQVQRHPTFPLTHPVAHITADAVTISAKLPTPLGTQVTIELEPKVADGHLVMEVVRIQAGAIPLPSSLTEKISSEFRSILADTINSQEGLIVKSVRLADGRMIITGTIGLNTTSTPS